MLFGTRSVSFSLMAPLSLGAWPFEGRRPSEPDGPNSSIGLGTELPVVLNLNLGRGAVSGPSSRGRGLSLGYGAGYHGSLSYSSSQRGSDTWYERENARRRDRVSFAGHVFYIGLVLDEVVLRVSYMRDFDQRERRAGAVSIGLLVDFH